MNGASVKKVILMFFSGNDPICHSQKFQPSQTPPSHFLPISPRFLTNIRCQYFSLNIWVVYDQLELDWCIFDQNWAKTRPLHFQIFQILNAIDRRIVQWVAKAKVIVIPSIDLGSAVQSPQWAFAKTFHHSIFLWDYILLEMWIVGYSCNLEVRVNLSILIF